MDTDKKISIIIPAYNEAENIESTIRSIGQKLNDKNFDYEIIVVDDGSTDKTYRKAKGLSRFNTAVIRLEKNMGKGAAVKNGVLSADGDFLLYTDADNSTDISHLFDFLEKIEKYDILIGSRGLPESKILKRQPYYKEFLGDLANICIRKFLKMNYMDTQCGFKLFTREVAEKVVPLTSCLRWGFDFEFLKIAEAKGFKIKELPVCWKNASDSKVQFFDYFRTFKSLLDVKRRYD